MADAVMISGSLSNCNAPQLHEMIDISSMVSITVEHLQDLAERLRQEDHETAFNNDSKSIQFVIDALRNLDSERLKQHEELEAETIQASVYRHKLGPFAEEIEEEIRGAVTAARESNEANILNLKEKIDEILNETNDLEHKYKLLTVENCGLEPERDQLRIEHEFKVALLNQTLADRANMQIKLNDTRDHLRDTYQKIKDLEVALVDIDYEMKEDKEEAKNEREKLEKSVMETKKKVQEQATANLLKSREIKTFQAELNEKELQLDEKKKKIRQHETSRARLEGNQVQLNRQIQKEVRENAALTQEGMKIVEAGTGSSQKLIETQNELNETRNAIDSEMKKASTDFARLNSEKMRLSNELELAKAQGTREKDEADEMQKKLRLAKDELLFLNDECSSLKRANTDLESSIEQMLQDHQAIVELLNKQIGDSTVNLAAERKERQALQNKRDMITKEMNEFKTDYGKIMTGITKKITEGKTEHQRLTEHGLMLQKSLKQDETDILNKQKDLKKKKQQFSTMQKRFNETIKNLQDSISGLKHEIAEKNQQIDSRMPHFEDLEKTFARKTSEFEEMKKYIVDLKNKKSGVELSIERTSNEISKMQNPQNTIRAKITEDRRKYLESLKKQTGELKDREHDIFLANQRLNLVNKENERMAEAIGKLREEKIFMKDRRLALLDGKVNVEKHIFEYKELLDEKWIEDIELDKEYCRRDRPYIDDLKEIEIAAIKRGEKIEEVHGKLEEQLNILAEFIDGVAGLRPT